MHNVHIVCKDLVKLSELFKIKEKIESFKNRQAEAKANVAQVNVDSVQTVR